MYSYLSCGRAGLGALILSSVPLTRSLLAPLTAAAVVLELRSAYHTALLYSTHITQHLVSLAYLWLAIASIFS